ncbi:non-ribosomal peptide synthetase [Anaeromicropila populeti]|uniref:Pyochelin synthetase n=1 Tax=Anaeromicropila populeti TaxID=37658 RepID=A0A1I6JXK5_9FIRM|nr:non-ribosomal peptide synthetase [Anaeromicropila populeti]SFR83676.1 pyochelin synthetase [Anaeromicropila populeti]
MIIEKIIEKYSDLGVQFWSENGQLRFRAPGGVMTQERKKELGEYKEKLIEYYEKQNAKTPTADKENQYQPFELTDIQTAYLVGRNSVYEHGNVGCHAYVELTMPVMEKERLETAWHQVIKRHDMLRAIVRKEGYQQVLEEVTLPELDYHDLKGCSGEEVEAGIEGVRNQLSHKQYQPDQWPLFDFVLTTTDQESILHFSIDMLVADFVSINIMLNELDHFYYEPETELPELEISFRDFMLFQEELKARPSNKIKLEKDRQYWMERIDQLPEGPELPVIEKPDKKEVRFVQYKTCLEKEKWSVLCENAKKLKVTPSVVILAAYAETIGRWSKISEFSMNLTILNRPELHNQINSIIGDFTMVDVLEISPEKGQTFIQQVKAIQERLWSDLEHREFSGIELLREMTRQRNKNIIIPVVYTSTIGVNDKNKKYMRDAELTYKISQTPQVWIDCQALEQDGSLLVNWDVREGVFPDGMIEAAFSAFAKAIEELASNQALWENRYVVELPEQVLKIRKQVNDTACPLSKGLLQDGFLNQLRQHPNAYALISKENSYTYRELGDYAGTIQKALYKAGCQKGDVTAVILEKGVWQIGAILGILVAGGVYLPIDVSQPRERTQGIIKESGAKYVITNKEREGGVTDTASYIYVEQLEKKEGIEWNREKTERSEPAYVIYTSGSTGKPKGVVISHGAAWNTIEDINQKFHIKEKDKVFGLASCAFDLSVYDIFGTFLAGATLVLPDEELRRVPGHWLELVLKHQVTVWNSVPVQMQMLINCMEDKAVEKKLPFKVILLSGDWIPVPLARTIREKYPDTVLISLGGATEAAIWSIYHSVDKVSDNDKSIPYGKPIANQQFYILNEQGKSCPDWVTGHLYIGGEGLALGYLHDEDLTNSKFIYHPDTKERLYDTGDMGRYWPDGTIEFLGREDTQVKIRGHRIEISEIESVLQNHPDVSMAAVMKYGSSPLDYKLAGFVQTQNQQEPDYYRVNDQEIVQVCNQAIEEKTAKIEPFLLTEWFRLADQTTLLDIMSTFYEAGLFTSSTDQHSVSEIINTMHIIPKYHQLLKRWLKALCEDGFLKKDAATDYYALVSQPYTKEQALESQREWRKVEDKLQYGETLFHYMRQSSDLLPELLNGEKDPLDLFFPKGKLDVALAAYQNNLVNHCLNTVVKEGLLCFVRQQQKAKEDGHPVRILEVGAGVGGTSAELIPALDNSKVEYHFTDISTFFLNEARNRYEKYPWVSYGLYDINEDNWKQGFTSSSWDVIICANVLHNSKNAPSVLESLKELVVPGGMLMMIEATGDNHALLTSMEFKDGLHGFTDLRAGSDQVFMGREQWGRMFADAGMDLIYSYPCHNDSLEAAGQAVYINRLNKEKVSLEADTLKTYLQSKLPEYMIPGRIEILSKLPLTENGKVDRKRLQERLDNTLTDTVILSEPPKDQLEERIADIWSEILNFKTINRNDNFFEIGGDSLLVAQVVAKMQKTLEEAKSMLWDKLMLEMLKTPTVAEIAEKFRNGNTEIEDTEKSKAERKNPLVIFAEGNTEKNAMKVLFPGGIGTLTQFNNILPYLLNDPDRTETIGGFQIVEEEQCLEVPSETFIRSLGQQYAEILLEKKASSYELIGYCFGGLVAVETARNLLEAGAEVKQVITIDTLPNETMLDSEVLMEKSFSQFIGADAYQAGHVIEDKLLKEALEEISAKQKGWISTEAICSLTGSLKPVADCYQKLSEKEHEERLQELVKTVDKINGKVSETELKNFELLYDVFRHISKAVWEYTPEPFAGDVTILSCKDRETSFLPEMKERSEDFLGKMILGDFKVIEIEGNHATCIMPPNVEGLVQILMGGKAI